MQPKPRGLLHNWPSTGLVSGAARGGSGWGPVFSEAYIALIILGRRLGRRLSEVRKMGGGFKLGEMR